MDIQLLKSFCQPLTLFFRVINDALVALRNDEITTVPELQDLVLCRRDRGEGNLYSFLFRDGQLINVKNPFAGLPYMITSCSNVKDFIHVADGFDTPFIFAVIGRDVVLRKSDEFDETVIVVTHLTSDRPVYLTDNVGIIQQQADKIHLKFQPVIGSITREHVFDLPEEELSFVSSFENHFLVTKSGKVYMFVYREVPYLKKTSLENVSRIFSIGKWNRAIYLNFDGYLGISELDELEMEPIPSVWEEKKSENEDGYSSRLTQLLNKNGPFRSLDQKDGREIVLITTTFEILVLNTEVELPDMTEDDFPVICYGQTCCLPQESISLKSKSARR